MNRMYLAMSAVCAMSLFSGCGKNSGSNLESAYEQCLNESMKNVPGLISKPTIKKAMANFRALPPEEQRKALNEIRVKLGK